jgi:hypothetical protein
MDRRERYSDHQEALRTTQDAHQSGIWTALPGVIQSFNAGAATVTVQPAIQGQFRGRDGTTTSRDMPLLVDVPVVFPRGGGVTLTFPIAVGDECLVVFASRCIDGWWQQGGSQPQIDARMHDLSDGFAVPGPFSQKTKIGGIATGSAQLRSDDGNTYVEVLAGHVNVRSATAVTLQAPSVTITSDDVQINGASLKHNGKNVGSTHTHTGVQPGGGTSGPPT